MFLSHTDHPAIHPTTGYIIHGGKESAHIVTCKYYANNMHIALPLHNSGLYSGPVDGITSLTSHRHVTPFHHVT